MLRFMEILCCVIFVANAIGCLFDGKYKMQNLVVAMVMFLLVVIVEVL